MPEVETIEQFYQSKYGWIPDNLKNEMGHFNVFKLDPFVGENARPGPCPYRRRDFYKITLAIGNGVLHYPDKSVEVKEQALVFSNPLMPYRWERLDTIESGFFCVFNHHFFHKYGDLSRYPVFQTAGPHVFELEKEQIEQVKSLYEKMFEEIDSDYVFKYDVLRNLVFELTHLCLKIKSCINLNPHPINASTRISTLFLELLERQFPIDDNHQKVNLRSASDFAAQLNVHVNHLNRAVKETASKTTSQVVAERILQEAKVLLRQSTWNISEIAYALGFAETTHFNNFFKKHTGDSPLKFRKIKPERYRVVY